MIVLQGLFFEVATKKLSSVDNKEGVGGTCDLLEEKLFLFPSPVGVLPVLGRAKGAVVEKNESMAEKVCARRNPWPFLMVRIGGINTEEGIKGFFCFASRTPIVVDFSPAFVAVIAAIIVVVPSGQGRDQGFEFKKGDTLKGIGIALPYLVDLRKNFFPKEMPFIDIDIVTGQYNEVWLKSLDVSPYLSSGFSVSHRIVHTRAKSKAKVTLIVRKSFEKALFDGVALSVGNGEGVGSVRLQF